jgi:hypothetical protein
MFSTEKENEINYDILNVKIDDVKNDLKGISKNIKDINENIKIICEKLDVIDKSAQNMDEHISFVENVYDVVRNPIKTALQYYYKTPGDQNFIEMKLIKKS